MTRWVQFEHLEDGRARSYELRGLLGEGGMGSVYQAFDPELGRTVALKILQGDLSPERRARFVREGLAAAKLTHPGIVPVLETGAVANRPCLVFGLVEGARPLNEAWAGLELGERLDLLEQVCEALAHAHEAGVIHRDIKPDNVLVDQYGRAHLGDFGLAWISDGDRLTQTGAFMGTPHTMAPEQIRRQKSTYVGPATDVWALGVLLYLALCDQWPFDGDLVTILAQIARARPTPPSRLKRSTPAAIEGLCLRTLHVEPTQRPADAGAFLTALREARARAPSRGAPLLVLLGLMALVSAGFLALQGSTSPPQTPPPSPTGTPAATSTPTPPPTPTPQEARVRIRLERRVAATIPLRFTEPNRLLPTKAGIWAIVGGRLFLAKPGRGSLDTEAIELEGTCLNLAEDRGQVFLLHGEKYGATEVVVSSWNGERFMEVWRGSGKVHKFAHLFAWEGKDGARRILVATASSTLLTLDDTGKVSQAVALDMRANEIRAATFMPRSHQFMLAGSAGRMFLRGVVHDADTGKEDWEREIPGTPDCAAEIEPGVPGLGVRAGAIFTLREESQLFTPGPFVSGMPQGLQAHEGSVKGLASRGEVFYSLAWDGGQRVPELAFWVPGAKKPLERWKLEGETGGSLWWDSEAQGLWVTSHAGARLRLLRDE